MALIGNCALLHKSPAKYTTGSVGFNDRANWNKPGMMRNRGDLTVSLLWKYDAVPSGFYAGRAFFPPQKAGRITSRQSFSISGTASGAEGLPGAASASFAIGADAIGGLIAGGVANATITISGSGSIAGLAAGGASGTMTINGTGQIGATAWGIANATITVNGVTQPYAMGYMEASTVDNSVMTPATISAAVWNSQLSEYQITGSAGKALSTASSGGVDLNALAEAVWEYVDRTLTAGGSSGATPEDIAEAILAAAQLAPIHADIQKVNAVEVKGTGTTSDPWNPVS